MPSWITHLVTANKVSEKINIEKDEFIFGNIMPDILVGFNVNVEKTVPYAITHFAKIVNINGIDIPVPNIEEYKKEYSEKFDNPVVLGYFTHLLTDYFWNEYSYRTYFEIFDKENRIVKLRLKNGKEKILTWKESVQEKQRDFALFAKYLQKNLKLELSINANKILEDSKAIKEFAFTKKDIENTILYLDNIEEVITANEEYKIFSQKEFEQKLDESIEFIMENIAKGMI